MTATEEPQITQVNIVTSSSSLNIRLYFQIAVLLIGIGTAAKVLILYAMVVSKKHNKHLPIFNQYALDIFSYFFMVITNAVTLFNVSLAGSLRYWLCTVIITDIFVLVGNVGGVINLAIIAIESYLE